MSETSPSVASRYDDVRHFYHRVIQKYEEAEYYARLPLNFFWATKNMRDMRNIIQSAGSEVDVIHGAQRTFMFSVNVAEPQEQLAVDWLLEEQRSRGIDLFSLPGEIQESPFSYPPNNVLRGGRLLTPDFLRTVNISLGIARHVASPPKGLTVVELGGGLGHLARTLRLLGVSSSHVIIDLPETLVFSFCFLKKNFPEARLLLVDETTSPDIRLADYDFALVPALYAERVLTEDLDLFINTASMGEMRNEVIRHWMDFVQNGLRVRYLYTLNRYLNTIIPGEHAWRLEENECSVHYDQRWDILRWEVEPPFTRCPYIDTQISRYVEIIARRVESTNLEECKRKASELIDLVKQEDWCRMPAERPAVMTMRDNVLVNNMTQTGTLFKLWEALRLQPTTEASALMIRYLDTLCRYEDKEFEEMPYYEWLFLRLFEAAHEPALQPMADYVADRLRARESKITRALLSSVPRRRGLRESLRRYVSLMKVQ
jgi:hypothetical protein